MQSAPVLRTQAGDSNRLVVLDDGGVEALGVLDVDSLDVGVELLLGALLVVTLTGDADAEAERNTLDAGLPDLLVELGVEADVLGALGSVSGYSNRNERVGKTHHGLLSESTDLLDGAGSPLLEAHAMDLLASVLAYVPLSLPPDTRSEVSPPLQAIDGLQQTESTYALVQVDRVFASNDVGDGAAGGLARGLGGLSGAHFCGRSALAIRLTAKLELREEAAAY